MTDTGKYNRRRLAVTGQVQGVGFRPFVYRLAAELALTGFVSNDARGVTIEVQGCDKSLRAFSGRLCRDMPPLAEIHKCEESPAELRDGEECFEIRPSSGGELADAQITVDTAVCDECLREMHAPADPRHGYPFINCTNCGPRYTIVSRIPYDRPNTTMADFPMCPLCAGQYADPADRRFHAQPVACPKCGPTVWLVDAHGRPIQCDAPIAEAAAMLLAGRIVAVKGLGGFHLACRADDDHAVKRLRRRKRRDAKPFAVMVAGLERAAALCELTGEAEKLLAGPIRPVVLLPRRADAHVALSVAQGLSTLGLMLPYTPLHHLLFARAGLADLPLVMTSGNYSDEPLVKDNAAAVAHLGRIADAMLLHNRRIERRLDDSVVQLHDDGRLGVVRRARGYAPRPVRLTVLGYKGGIANPTILAVGAELKNAFCLLAGDRAVVSEHVGDLKDARTYRHFIDTVRHVEKLFEVEPGIIAADMHPQYLSSEYAAGRAAAGEPVRVQHHHAHVAACMAENGRRNEVIGLVCDGVGYGDDGTVWGCEVLRADLCDYERLGHLRTLKLIGGDAAAVQTWRPALAALYDTFGDSCLEVVRECRLAVPDKQLQPALQMLAADGNCPSCSSLGRWFDAVAQLVGVAQANEYEGQAPMKLEAAIELGVEQVYPYRIDPPDQDERFVIDLRPMVQQIVGDLSGRSPAGVIAAKFHNTVVAFLADAAQRAGRQTGLDAVALSGGCFANRYITARLAGELEHRGLEVLRHRTIPCNDGGVALGQAVVAAARKAGQLGKLSSRREAQKVK
ncbi:MAG: carbamoyltransferase HypF [Planctomycetota bacterium]|nr:carbamoyltransferase HypF [Planctomycetota bacterium]